ncbi:MAG TPA: alpha-E domain-containing protein [Pseudonocardiaceae bacterium]|nr:alpha-E domain-containing protein [Pseudonocardiaceae bacterium]
MLLSRFAESLYWAGRYLERAETTARLIKVHTELFLDLPRSAGVGWSPLLAVTGSNEEFLGRHAGPEEEDVVGFLATDPKNLGSILASISQARVNLRVSRVLLPSPSWEVVTDLHGWASATSEEAIDRRSRLRWMDSVISDCHLLVGMLAGTMCDDEAYAFLQIGRHLERADMTTRVLDVQAGILLSQRAENPGGTGDIPYHDVTWMSVLRSLCAHQMFRRSVGCGVSGPDALRFLLQDAQFPRSVEFCLASASRSLLQLPRSALPMARCARIHTTLRDLTVTDIRTPDELHELSEALQEGIGDLHDTLAQAYFRLSPEPVLSSDPAMLELS